MRILRSLAISGGLLTGLLSGGQAVAAPCTVNAVISVSSFTTCTVQVAGATFQLDPVSSNLPSGGATQMAITNFGGALTVLVNTFALALAGPITGTFQYSITPLSGVNFNSVKLSSTIGSVGQTPTVVTKTFEDALNLPSGPTLTNTNGVEDSDKITFASIFTVIDDFSVAAGGALFSISNTFTFVPEPTSLALLGAGLAGLGLARRRRQIAG